MQSCLIFNPAARGHRAADLRDSLAALSACCELRPTDAAGAAQRLAAEAVDQGFRTIVAAGGDGTINEVVNGLAARPDLLPEVRLGILPTGTANVFAKDLGLPIHWAEAWEIIRRGHERRIDLPFADYHEADAGCRRHFVQLAGAGLDSRAIALVEGEHKKRFGPAAYVFAGFQALLEPLPMVIVSDGTTTAQGELVMIGNGRLYGGRFKFFPGARLDDGLLDVVVFPRTTLGTLIEVGCGWLVDDLLHAVEAITLQSSSFTLQSDGPVPFELDGENVGPLPARFGVQPKALRVLVPG